MRITTINIKYITNYTSDQLVVDSVYNLLVKEGNQLVDIRCRIIGKKGNLILIFKLKDE